MPRRITKILSRSVQQIFYQAVTLFLGITSVLYSQSLPNTQITNQAKASYNYKSFPTDTIRSNTVLFAVKEAPNFSMAFSPGDSNVFGKETLTVRLTYTNIGNAKADSATIEGILPAAGMRFVPGSTGGMISGKSVIWKILNIEAGGSDSVTVRVIVDSTLVAGTTLEVNGSISWQSASVPVFKTFIVGSFPRLEISNTPAVTIVGSGRPISYTVSIRNTGNIQSVNTVLIDSISSTGIYLSSDVTPDSLSSNKRRVRWNIGSIPAFSSKSVTINVLSQPNTGIQSLLNTAVSSAANVSESASAQSIVQIVPIAPKSMDLSADPKFIFGQSNKDSSKIVVVLKDSLGMLLPDGVNVRLSTTSGTFGNNLKSITTTIQDGFAVAYVRSEDIQNQIKPFTVTATGGTVESGTISGSTQLFLYPGAVTGKVVSGLEHSPYKGAIASVYNQSRDRVGADTTKSDGKFFIALNKDVTRYTLEIVVIDKFGDTVVASTSIDPTQFPLPAIAIPNSISGRILYKLSGLPVPAAGVTVFLDSIASLGQPSPKNVKNKVSGQYGVLSRVQEQKTDSYGRFKFDNLHPAVYAVSVDSTQFPNMKSTTVISDTSTGTFTINLSLEIIQDSTITMVLNAPATADAGDTLRYSIVTDNTGNYLHQAATVTDTLPPFTKFLSSQNGNYSTFTFDSTTRVLQWTRDSLMPAVNDSVSFSVLLTRNIPDSTRIRNSAWFKSNQNLVLNRNAMTTVKSASILSFGNFFAGRDSIVAGDSIQNKIWFANTGTDSLRNVKIIDTLYFAGDSKIRFSKAQFDSVVVVDSILTMFIGAIPPGRSDTLSFSVISDFSLPTGTKILSKAYLLHNDSVIVSASAVLTMMENTNLSSFLKIVKTGNKKTAEIGDIITYQVQISNTSPTFVHTLGVYDLLPHAFRYISRSARYNGKPIEPFLNKDLNSLTWNIPDTIQTGKNGLLVYQLAIGADAMESQGMNTAYATAVANPGTQLLSAPSQWQVTVRPGVFTEKGLVIGKVFYDDNRNDYQENGETGIKNVELWMEDGTKIITGDDGKYSLPDVKPGEHVLRVDERSLPPGSSLIGGSTSFAKDPISRFVKVTESGIAKANFFVRRNLKDSLRQSVGLVNKLMAVRQSVPKYLYSDSVHNVTIDTVDMYVSFAFNGNKFLQSIEVNEILPAEFVIVPNSGTFNGRNVNPIVYGTSVNWKLGRAKQSMQGVLHYRAALRAFPKNGSSLLSVASVKVMTADSMFIESNKLLTENIINDVPKNAIETSDIFTTNANPDIASQLGDSVTVGNGGEVFFKTIIFINPRKMLKSVQLIDSLESSFMINERSFSVNGIPIPRKNLSVKIKSSSFTSREAFEKNEIDFLRISSVNLTEMLRGGLNEITYTAKLQSAERDTMYQKKTYAIVKNEFDEESIVHTAGERLYIRAGSNPLSVHLETSYADKPRKSVNTAEKIADAVKLVQSLTEKSAKSIVIEGITFEYGKATLTAQAMEILDGVAGILNAHREINLRINGYTDNTGNASINRKMSLVRAKEVRNYLIGKGIDGKRLFAQGFGPEHPIATNKTEDGRAKNRRVEFERIN